MNIKKIINEVCERYGVSESELKSDRRLKQIVTAKKVVWKVMALDGKSTNQIGAIFNKDHSTVCVGINSLMKQEKDYEYAVKLYMKYRDNEELNPKVSKKQYSNIIRNEIRKRINMDKTNDEISEELDLSVEYVGRVVNQIKLGCYKYIPDYKNCVCKKYYV